MNAHDCNCCAPATACLMALHDLAMATRGAVGEFDAAAQRAASTYLEHERALDIHGEWADVVATPSSALCTPAELVEAIEAWQLAHADLHTAIVGVADCDESVIALTRAERRMLHLLDAARLRPEQEARATENQRCADAVLSLAWLNMCDESREELLLAVDAIRSLALTPPAAPERHTRARCGTCAAFAPAEPLNCRRHGVGVSPHAAPCTEYAAPPAAPAPVLDPAAVLPLIRAVRAYRRAPSYDWFMRFGDIGEAYDALPAAWREAAQRGVPRG